MRDLKETIMKGWPEEKANIPDTFRPYHQYRDELAVHDGLIYRGERVVIPATLKSAMKEELHSEDADGETRTRNPWITNPVL